MMKTLFAFLLLATTACAVDPGKPVRVNLSNVLVDPTPTQFKTANSLLIGTNLQAWNARLDVLAANSGTLDLGGITITLPNNSVTNAKLATMPTMTIKGNNTGSTANAADLSASQVKTVLGLNNVENTALSTWLGTTTLITGQTEDTAPVASTDFVLTWRAADNSLHKVHPENLPAGSFDPTSNQIITGGWDFYNVTIGADVSAGDETASGTFFTFGANVSDMNFTGPFEFVWDNQTGSGDGFIRFQQTGGSDLTLNGAFSGNGSGLTSLNASNLSSGKVPVARLTDTFSDDFTFKLTGASHKEVLWSVDTDASGGFSYDVAKHDGYFDIDHHRTIPSGHWSGAIRIQTEDDIGNDIIFVGARNSGAWTGGAGDFTGFAGGYDYFNYIDATGSGSPFSIQGSGVYFAKSTNFTKTALGTTQADSLLIQNLTAATAGNQQISPSVRWQGRGWKTNSTAASQTVDWRADVLPIQGTSAPTSQWQLSSAVNGGSFTNRLALSSSGALSVDSIAVASATVGGNSVAERLTQPGEIRPYAGPIAPSGWLFCYGQQINRTTYAAAYAALVHTATVTVNTGTDRVNWTAHGLHEGDPIIITATTTLPGSTFDPLSQRHYVHDPTANDFQLYAYDASIEDITSAGSGTITAWCAPWEDNGTGMVGNGTTTFTLPDFRGRVLAGNSYMGGTVNTRLYGNAFSDAPPRLGEAGGEADHLLTVDEMPSHTHTFGVDVPYSAGTSGDGALGFDNNDPSGGPLNLYGETDSTGSDQPHSVVQPTALVNYIIFVGP